MIWYQTDNSQGVDNNDIRVYDDFTYVTHFHRDFELIYVERGEVEVTVEGKITIAKAGQMALILSNLIHSFDSPGGSQAIVHVFSQDNVPAFAKLVADKDVCTPVFDCDESVRDFYLSYCIQKEKRSKLAMKAALYAVCNDFYEKSTFVPSRSENTKLVHQMLSYISERYKEEITLEKMAQELGYEMHYLSRVFSTNVKINIRSYINLYRIDNARERLINSDDSIARIALDSGFQSVRNFNRVFSANVGMTPADYRNHFQNEGNREIVPQSD